MASNDPVEQNIQGVQSLVGSKLNKTDAGAVSQTEGVQGQTKDAFELDLTDDELLKLADRWTLDYAGYEAKINKRQEANKTYYLGRQKDGSPISTTGDGVPIAENLLFEAAETFYPSALSKNPEPVVWSDNTEQGTAISNSVKTMLQYHADVLVMRRKLTLGTRKWSVDLLGVWKHGWDLDINDIKFEVRDAKNFIFDKDGYVDCYGDFDGYLGERITLSADKLVKKFPKHKAYITVLASGLMGTSLTYTQWWNDDYTFSTLKGIVLEKSKNPYFNYPKPAPQLDGGGMPLTDDTGKPVMTMEQGHNHFAKPVKPYTFLSVFSFGDQPHDNTGLIEQNIPNQRRISRRTEQIDYNLSRANNSTAFSENNFNQETAKQAAMGRMKGHPILVPSGGPIDQALKDFPAQEVGPAFFNDLENSKSALRSIFGTDGLGTTPPKEQKTLGGLINNEQHDNTRIGGGVGDAIQQVAHNIFNWWTQLYYVFYDDEHFASIMGQMKAVEYVTLTSQDLHNVRKLVISVSPDSMKPKDELTEMNMALELFKSGALDPKTLLTMLNVPDPQKTAESTVLWLIDQNAYMQLNFPEVGQQLAQIQQQAMAQQNAMAMQQGQQQMQMQGQQGQQQIEQKGQMAQQQIVQKEQMHQQKMAQMQDLHKAKLEQKHEPKTKSTK